MKHNYTYNNIGLILLPAILIVVFFSQSYILSFYEGAGSWMGDSRFFRYNRKTPELWPKDDRIREQIAYIPANLSEMTQNGTKLKTILLRNASRLWIIPTLNEQQTFLDDNCLVNTCRITSNYSEFPQADVVIFNEMSVLPTEARPNEEQIWVLYTLESPLNTPRLRTGPVFNWTVNYRPDSDVPNPYGKFFLYDPLVRFLPQSVNYAANKTKKVAWFASNCNTANKRLQYVLELRKFIDVDHFGSCFLNNNRSCPRTKSDECNRMLKNDYKFYLSFENSNCRHYITEKFFYNALGNDVLPIVMGARRDDYERAAPFHSFIHVDDFESPKALAEYLHLLNNNDTLYNKYFQWKGTGEFSLNLNAHFWCRFCAMLHSDIQKKTYDDVNTWWRGYDICTSDRTWGKYRNE